MHMRGRKAIRTNTFSHTFYVQPVLRPAKDTNVTQLRGMDNYFTGAHEAFCNPWVKSTT